MPANKSKKAVALRNEKAELLKDAVESGDLDKVKDLVKNGANVNKLAISDYNQYYPLENAARKGHAECMRFLIDNGAKLNPRRKRGQMVLLLAAVSGNPECLQVLFDEGMDVDERGENDYTATMSAADYNRQDCMKLLLQYNPDLSLKSCHDTTVLHIAAASGSPECVRLLLNHTPKPDIEYMKPHSRYSTPLCIASHKGHTDIVKLLLENGANVNAGQYGFSPLRLAIETSSHGCAYLLCDYGADMKVAEGEESFLVTVTRNAQHMLVEGLLYRGFDPNEKSCHQSPGVYPIDVALQTLITENWRKEDRGRVLKNLLRYGAYLDLCDLLLDTRKLFYDNDLKQVEMYVLAMMTGCAQCVQSLYFKAMEIFEKEPNKLNQVQFQYEKAMSLENQTCRYIRRYVNSSGVFGQFKHFPAKADSLPLPEEVKKLVCLKHMEPYIEARW